MAELLSQNIKYKFEELLNSTNQSFRMICPFIGHGTSNFLAKHIHESNFKTTIITKFNRADFYSGVSSIVGLKHLHEAGATIKAIKNLHTKLYIFDSNSIIIGSSNFTNGGLISNLELNVLIQESKKITNQATAYFDQLEVIIGEEFIVTSELIQQEIKEVEILKSNKTKSKKPTESFGKKYKATKKFDNLEKSLSVKSTGAKSSTSAWLKFEGFSDDRRTLPTEKLNINLESNNCYKTRFPTRPVGYKDGEIIFLARHSLTDSGEKSPIVYGYGITRKFNKDNVVPIEEQEANENLKRWPYYIYVENFRHLEGKLNIGIPLVEVYKKLGNKTYPTRVNKETSYAKLKEMHRRRDKMRITEDTKEYLLDRLNEIL